MPRPGQPDPHWPDRVVFWSAAAWCEHLKPCAACGHDNTEHATTQQEIAVQDMTGRPAQYPCQVDGCTCANHVDLAEGADATEVN